jgi:hypothetical protein
MGASWGWRLCCHLTLKDIRFSPPLQFKVDSPLVLFGFIPYTNFLNILKRLYIIYTLWLVTAINHLTVGIKLSRSVKVEENRVICWTNG